MADDSSAYEVIGEQANIPFPHQSIEFHNSCLSQLYEWKFSGQAGLAYDLVEDLLAASPPFAFRIAYRVVRAEILGLEGRYVEAWFHTDDIYQDWEVADMDWQGEDRWRRMMHARIMRLHRETWLKYEEARTHNEASSDDEQEEGEHEGQGQAEEESVCSQSYDEQSQGN